jgi:hypothetical protein
MAIPKSQSYTVDNRYQQAKEVSDNTQSLGFLRNYMKARNIAGRFPVTSERAQDDRFVFAAQSGTLPLAAFPSEPRGAAGVSNTDGRVSYRNSFRVTPS